MVQNILRSLFAFAMGAAVAMFFIIAVEFVTLCLWPFPEGVDSTDMEICKAHVAAFPTAAFVISTIGWMLASLLGPMTATRIGTGQHPAHGIILGLLLYSGALLNLSMLPYPAWFRGINVVGLPACFIAGTRIGQRHRPV